MYEFDQNKDARKESDDGANTDHQTDHRDLHPPHAQVFRFAVFAFAGLALACGAGWRFAASMAPSNRAQASGSGSGTLGEGVSLMTGDLSVFPTKKYDDYWQALGIFTHNFSRTEQTLLHFVRKLARVPDPVGRALIGSFRIKDGMELAIKLLDARGHAEVKARLESGFAQLTAINTMRNNLIHWGASFDRHTEDWIVSNNLYVTVPAKRKDFRISVEMLDLMSKDLFKLRVHLAYETSLLYRRKKPSGEIGVLGQIVLAAAWQYKPPQPNTRRGVTPRKTQKRPPLPQ